MQAGSLMEDNFLSLILIEDKLAFIESVIEKYECYQEIPQSLTADQPTTPQGRAKEH